MNYYQPIKNQPVKNIVYDPAQKVKEIQLKTTVLPKYHPFYEHKIRPTVTVYFDIQSDDPSSGYPKVRFWMIKRMFEKVNDLKALIRANLADLKHYISTLYTKNHL